MPVLITFPTGLPTPNAGDVKPAERRLMSDVPGFQQSRPIQSDYLATQEVSWLFTAEQADIFNVWWIETLLKGGRWFEADWPLPKGWMTAIRRFQTTPRWEHVPGGSWRVAAVTQIRGLSLSPLLADPPSHWNPIDIISGGDLPIPLVLTDDTRIATRQGVNIHAYEAGVRGTLSHSTFGKWYFELVLLSIGNGADPEVDNQNLSFGLVDGDSKSSVASRPPDSPDSDYAKESCHDWILCFTRFDGCVARRVDPAMGGIVFTGGSQPDPNDVFGFAWEVGVGVQITRNDTDMTYIATTYTGAFFPYMSAGTTLVNGSNTTHEGESVLICTGRSQFTYSPPSGFAPWG